MRFNLFPPDVFRIFTPMKEQVVDITKILSELTSELQSTHETIFPDKEINRPCIGQRQNTQVQAHK